MRMNESEMKINFEIHERIRFRGKGLLFLHMSLRVCMCENMFVYKFTKLIFLFLKRNLNLLKTLKIFLFKAS